MRVVTCAMPYARSVGISVFVGVGSRYDPEDRAGISHYVEHLVFKGTKRRPSARQISEMVEGVGGLINAGTEQELTVYWCKIADTHLDRMLDLLLDMLRNSLYEPAEIEKERMVLLEEQGMVNDYPSYQVEALIDELLWPNHPLGRDISGTRESVSGISRDMILGHVSQFYTPANIVVSVAGNLDHDRVVSRVRALTDGWAPHPPPAWEPYTGVQSTPQFRLQYRRTEQAHLAIGLPGLSLTHPDKHALDLLSVVLGEGMSSRLFLEVREEQGLAYDIRSGVTCYQDCGDVVITAGVDPKRVYSALQTILAEVSSLKEGVPAEELEKAKRLSTGRMLLRMEDTRAVSSWAGSQELLLGRVHEVDEVVEDINGVTPGDVHRVSNALLTTEKLNLAVVGPSRGQSRFQKALKL
jgi:predicted Zn-dependent peptidase